MKRIGVYTSGGDAPGMNACVRAVVRAGLYNGCEVVGIQHGYEGMIEGNFVDLGARSVSNIIQRGGTILRTARSELFRTADGRARAAAHLKKAGIEGLVAMGNKPLSATAPSTLTAPSVEPPSTRMYSMLG